MARDSAPEPGSTRPPSAELEAELEQALVTLEDAREEAAALARQRDDLWRENLALRSELSAERGRRTLREAAAEEVRRRYDETAATLAGQVEEAATREELAVSLEELRITTEALEEANTSLTSLNEGLQEAVAARTSELEAANAALREREEWLRLIFEGATDYAIFAMDAEGRVAEWNSGAERLLGFRADEVLGRKPVGMWTPEDRATRQPELEMCSAVEVGRAEDNRWHLRQDGSRFWAVGVMTPLFDHDGQLRGFLKILRDCTAERAAEEKRKVLQAELNHRVKNTLAVVQAVVAQTLRNATMPEELQEALTSRLTALARSHDLLTRNDWGGAPLAEILGQTLAPHAATAGEGRIVLSGPPVLLPAGAVVTLNLAFHELATNAAKYGALSVPEGRVEVSWGLMRPEPGAPPLVDLTWRERGGPAVRPPSRRGFGSRLIETVLAREFKAEVRLDFPPDGVECGIRLPLTTAGEAAA
ncbi:sensor histidine kinase [Sabulicella rubraurantiaca]|uniref:sensor histidine kinase n=1 Tax=Sabulicella rubraurantiaca TaxID=2811429 RepID=UPI001A97041D|nr:HWE histidine kinase domain-containing protein [Sabulicella rubraurantiaca]